MKKLILFTQSLDKMIYSRLDQWPLNLARFEFRDPIRLLALYAFVLNSLWPKANAPTLPAATM